MRKELKSDIFAVGAAVCIAVLATWFVCTRPLGTRHVELSAQGGTFNPMPPAEGTADYVGVTNLLNARLLGAVFGATGITNLWAGSQAAYDAIAVKDTKTLYFIEE